MIRTNRLISVVKQLDKLHPQGYRLNRTELSRLPGIAVVLAEDEKLTYKLGADGELVLEKREKVEYAG